MSYRCAGNASWKFLLVLKKYLAFLVASNLHTIFWVYLIIAYLYSSEFEVSLSLVAFMAFVFDLQQFDHDVSKYVFVFMLLGVLWDSWIWDSLLCFSNSENFLTISSPNIFSVPVSLSSPLGEANTYVLFPQSSWMLCAVFSHSFFLSVLHLNHLY